MLPDYLSDAVPTLLMVGAILYYAYLYDKHSIRNTFLENDLWERMSD